MVPLARGRAINTGRDGKGHEQSSQGLGCVCGEDQCGCKWGRGDVRSTPDEEVGGAEGARLRRPGLNTES